MSFWLIDKHSEHSALMIGVKRVLLEKTTRFQKIKVIETFDYGKALMLDDIIMFSERDNSFYHEMIVHVPLYSHPNPKNVLVIGGGDGGAATEILRHGCVDAVTVVEIDPDIPTISNKYFPDIAKGLNNKCCNLIIDDGSKFIQKAEKNSYDVIIVDSTDPSPLSRSLFTSRFFKTCYELLTKDGILVQQVGSPFYDSKTINKLRQFFSKIFKLTFLYTVYVPTYSNGFFSILLNSKKYNPVRDFDACRFQKDGHHMCYYNADIHVASFALPNFIKLI
ncbi:MAG: polyamine aminopropyltransferase [Pseudomonadota bacterium]